MICVIIPAKKMIEAHRIISSARYLRLRQKLTACVKGIVAEDSFAKTVLVDGITSFLLSLKRRAILFFPEYGFIR